MGINQTQQKRSNLDWAVDRTKDLSIAAEQQKIWSMAWLFVQKFIPHGDGWSVDVRLP